MKWFQRIISFCLALCLTLSAVPLQAFAEEEEVMEVAEEVLEEISAPEEMAEEVLEELIPEEVSEPEAEVSLTEELPEEVIEEITSSKEVMSASVVASGSAGENLTWTLDNQGTLIISGTGTIKNCTCQSGNSMCGATMPWRTMAADIVKVILEEGITTVCQNAFSKCINLEKVIMPSTVTLVGYSISSGNGIVFDKGAFTDCEKLTSAGPVGSGCDYEFAWTDEIPAGAFAVMTALEKITLPETISIIDFQAFYKSTANIKCAGPLGSGADLEYAWKSSFPEGAFWGFTGLKTIVFPENISAIAANTFLGCSGLTELTLPDTITSIGHGAFSGCAGLTKITLPKNLELIGDWAFNGCSSLKTLELPETLKRIGDTAFSGSALESISIPKNVTAIGSSAFSGCSSLKTIILPKNVNEVGSSVFYHCNSLEQVEIQASLTTIPQSSFNSCNQLKSVFIPMTVTAIESYAFNGCSNLTEVVFEGTFAQWEKITKGTYNEPLENAKIQCMGRDGGSCGENAIWTLDRSGKLVISGQGPVTQNPWMDLVSAVPLTEIVIEEGVTEIGVSLYRFNTTVKKITVAQSVTFAIRNPFFRFEGIESAGPIGSGADFEYGWTTFIPDYAFKDLWSLKKFSWPEQENGDEMLSIGNQAFFGCKSLEEIEIPDTVLNIGNQAFSYCESLRSLIVPYRVGSIFTKIVDYCTALEELTILGPVDRLYELAFVGCTSLREITLPRSLSWVQPRAFLNCSSLTDVHYAGTSAEWDEILIEEEGNESLLNAQVHTEWNACYLGDVRYFDSWSESKSLAHFSGDELECLVNEETDPDFAPEALLGSYVLVHTRWEGDQEVLLSAKPVQTVTDTVTFCSSFWTEIGGKTYLTPIDLEAPWQYEGEYVLCHTYEGNIVGISTLDFTDYLDNEAIVVNGYGNAYAFYKAPAMRNYTYRYNGSEYTAASDNRGILRIPLGEFRVPITRTLEIEIIKIGNVELDPVITLNPTVEVKPLSFTQTGVLSLNLGVSAALGSGGGLQIADWKLKAANFGSAEFGVEQGSVITLTRSHDGGYDSLELQVEGSYQGDIEIGSGIYWDTELAKPTRFTLFGANSAIASTFTGGWGLRIEDYVGDWAQDMLVGTAILDGLAQACENSPFLEKLMQNAWEVAHPAAIASRGVTLTTDRGWEFGAVEIDGEDLLTLGSFQKEGAFSMRTQNESNGTVKKSYQVNTEDRADWGKIAAEVSKLEIGLELTPYAEGRLTEDVSVTAEKKPKDQSVTATFLKEDSPGIHYLALGDYYDADYHRFTFRNSALDALLDRNPGIYDYLYADRKVLTDYDILTIVDQTTGKYEPIEYAQETKQKGLFRVPLTVGGGIGGELYGGVTVAVSDEISFDSALGVAKDDDIFINSVTHDTVSQQMRDVVMDWPEYFQDVLHGALEYLKEWVVTVSGAVSNGVKIIGAWIDGAPESEQDWEVSISAVDVHTQPLAVSYMVRTRTARQNIVQNEHIRSAGSYESDRAATVAQPYIIGVTERSTGEAVTDLSAEPLRFTIAYTSEDLTAAGISAQDAVVQNKRIAMYRYSNDGDYFEYVDGCHDPEAMTVTAEITKPGQYVLAADSCAPALKSLDLSDFHQNPTLTAYIDDLTGLDTGSFAFMLDGVVKVDGNNLSDYYDARLGRFTYTVPESEALSEGEHHLSFSLADTSGNADTYAFTFNVDLTAPVISDVSVTGAPNAGSKVLVRAQVSDPNLTAVYAVITKRLEDGSWSSEVTTAMGDMGSGLWGLDYEGDGNSIRVRIKAVDIAENTEESAEFEARPYAEAITVEQEYLALYQGQTRKLQVKVIPEELNGAVKWHIEGNEDVVRVENGLITAKNPGTAYVVAEVDDGETTLTARCRVDVRAGTKLDGVQLGSTSVTSELYSTDYSKLDILLILPQNVSGGPEELADSRSAARASAGVEIENTGVAMESVKFTNPDIAKLFDIAVVDDRTVRIIPTQEAIDNPKAVKNKYTDTLTIMVQGMEYVTEKLTLNVKKSMPKLKASIPDFNSFFERQSQQIVITGGTVTDIYENEAKNTAKSTAIPVWLRMEGGILTLTEDAPLKNTSAKAHLKVETEEWRIPAELTLNVKNSFKRPGLKLSASTVTVTTNVDASQGIPMTLMCSNKKDTLEALKVVDIQTPDGYAIENFDPSNGSFTLCTQKDFVSGKITLDVVIGGTPNRVPLTLNVKTAQVNLKPAKTSVTLNRSIAEDSSIPVTATPADYRITAPEIWITDSKNNTVTCFTARWDDGTLYISTGKDTPTGNYKVNLRAGGSKTAAVSVKIVSNTPSVSFKTKGNLDLSFPENGLTVTPAFKNYTGSKIASFDYTVTEMKGRDILDEEAEKYFRVNWSDGVFTVKWTDFENVHTGSTYALNLKVNLPDGTEIGNKVNFTVKRTDTKLKLSTGKISLNKTVMDVAEVTVTCTAKGYDFRKPLMELRTGNGKEILAGWAENIDHEKLKVTWNSGKLKITQGDALEFGDGFRLLVKANAYSSPVTLNISVHSTKTKITASLKAKGTIDVIRQGTELTLMPAYKNCAADTPWEQKLEVYTSLDKYKEPVESPFEIRENADGSFTLRNGGSLNPKTGYKIRMVANCNGVEVQTSQVGVSVKMNSAKLTLSANNPTLFARDKHARAPFRITTADQTLNPIREVRIKDAKHQKLFELKTYGSGSFALAFLDDTVDASLMKKDQTLTVPLQIFLEGNGTTSPNATVNLKVKILK